MNHLSNALFLLGGHDLEMLTIRDVLLQSGLCVADKGLTWTNAQLSRYQNEINSFRKEHPDGHIYSIELCNDLNLDAHWYHSIDHHNELETLPSALEQVMSLLCMPMNRRHKLIAANDSSYIPGMEALGATREEIAAIRLEDRCAQGVTQHEEQLAIDAINNRLSRYGDLIVVKALCSRFSPICDRLYPFNSLLVYTDDEWNYYGPHKQRLLDLFSGEVKEGKIYHGGGPAGYAGMVCDKVTLQEVKNQVQQIIIQHMHSYHIFYFPFRWERKGSNGEVFSDQVNLDSIPVNGQSGWKRVQINDDNKLISNDQANADDAATLFNERQYYYEYIHPVLYDAKSSHSLMHHYEHCAPQDKTRNVQYTIVVNNGKGTNKLPSEEYTLRVDAINLNLYATGVGLLIFYLANEREDQSKPYAIRRINQYGRRIMPPNSFEFEINAESGSRSSLSCSIAITGLGDDKKYEEDFNYTTKPAEDCRGLHSVWKSARFIENLIGDLSHELKVTPVIDDRMLVNCWYGNDELSYAIKHKAQNPDSPFVMGDFWYKYVFVDEGSDDTCQNDAMKRNILAKSTYFRWQKYGTLYGVSRYSLVALTSREWFSMNVLSKHMRTIYSRLFELVIVQRASMLRFSSEVTAVSNLLHHDSGKNEKPPFEQINSLYREYIRFINQVYSRNVTAQDQGIELYEMLSSQFDLSNQIKDLDDEISELHQYATLQIDQKRNANAERLNKVAAFFLLPSLALSWLGINHCLLCGFILAVFCAIISVLYMKRKKLW